MKQAKKKNVSTIILVAILLIGIFLLLYPTLSEYWNSFHQSQAIAGYTQTVAEVDTEEYERILGEIRAYNEKVADSGIQWILPEEQREEYNRLLDVTGTGIMGYIEIPKINCSLAVYHGTEESVLQIAVGHIEGSSLPIGGENTHCILSGHRGLPSAKLFTELDELEIGDLFMLHVLDETATYAVEEILIVEPHDVSNLEIERGKDLCTLVTCTPYGVNTHRLLVRAHRVENLEEASVVRVTADAMQVEPLLVAPVVAIPMLLILLIVLLISTGKQKKERKSGGAG